MVYPQQHLNFHFFNTLQCDCYTILIIETTLIVLGYRNIYHCIFHLPSFLSAFIHELQDFFLFHRQWNEKETCMKNWEWTTNDVGDRKEIEKSWLRYSPHLTFVLTFFLTCCSYFQLQKICGTIKLESVARVLIYSVFRLSVLNARFTLSIYFKLEKCNKL